MQLVQYSGQLAQNTDTPPKATLPQIIGRRLIFSIDEAVEQALQRNQTVHQLHDIAKARFSQQRQGPGQFQVTEVLTNQPSNMTMPTQTCLSILIGKALDQGLGVLSSVDDTLSSPAHFLSQLINRAFGVLHHTLLLRCRSRGHLLQSVLKIPAMVLSSP
ncbi:hypothetical protein D9M71_515070 [compost metagenome]